MSRLPFWLPPGQVSRSIPKVRFDGVEPGSQEAHELYRAYAPMIDQFYLKMARQHAAGIVDQSHGQRQFGDGLMMSYINQFGNETIRIKGAVVTRGGKQAKKRTPPDWLYIEFNAVEGGGKYPHLAAFARIPRWDKAAPYNPGYFRVGLDDPGTRYVTRNGIVRAGFADAGVSDIEVPITEVARGSTDRRTFVMDLRPLHGFSAVEVDFYGVVECRDTGNWRYDVAYYQSDGDNDVVVDNIVETWYDVWEFDPAHDNYLHESSKWGAAPCYGDDPGYTVPAAAFTAMWDAMDDGRTIFDVPFTKATPEPFIWYGTPFGSGGKVSIITPGPDFGQPADWWRSDNTWTWVVHSRPYYAVYTPVQILDAPMTVSGRLMGGGNIEWLRHRWTHAQETGLPYPVPTVFGDTYSAFSQDYTTWELPEKEPPLKLSQLGDVDITALSAVDYNGEFNFDHLTHFGLPYIGTTSVVMDSWGLSWGTPGSKT